MSTIEQRKRAKFAKHWAEWIPDVLIRPLLNTKPEIKIIANIFDVDLPEITVEGENAPDAPSFGVLSSVSDLTKMSEEIKRLLKENQELQDSQVTSQMVRSQASDENETLKSQIMALQTQLASSEQDKLAMSAKLEEIVRSQEQAEKTFAEREQVLQSQVQEKEDLIASTMTDQQTEMSKQLAEFLQRQDELQAEVDAKKRENADAKQVRDIVKFWHVGFVLT
jgi:DNA repair exonuclease SbcCD ATPase subunit